MKERRYTKESLTSLFVNDKTVANEVRSFLAEELSSDAVPDYIDASKVEAVFDGFGEGEFSTEEAVVLLTGRPALLIREGTWEKPVLAEIEKRLSQSQPEIEKSISSVGRVEIANLYQRQEGTAWVIDERTLITNRHVVERFSWHDDNVLRFRTVDDDNPFRLRSITGSGRVMRPQIDFLEEYENDEAFEVEIERILHVERRGEQFPDIAFLRLKEHKYLPDPIPLATEPPRHLDQVAAIGYPQKDLRNDLFVMERIFRSIYDVKRISPGLLTGVEDPRGMLISHDCTTLGGSSGSVIISLETGKAVGIHFSGDYKVNNFAVRSSAILDRLHVLGQARSLHILPGSQSSGRECSQGSSEEGPRPPTSEDLRGRKGYDRDFLRRTVPLPKPSDGLRRFVTRIPETRDDLLKYTHFSIMMHETRKLALFTAVNIDGSRLIRYERGEDEWHPDPRLNDNLQTLDEYYASSRIRGRRRLHRGHLVRRLDPMWGDSEEEILQAQSDTFFFTNCSPQHERFNPRSWLNLENYVLNAADDDNFRVNVFTGPVLAEDDEDFRGRQLPSEFWKVISVYVPRRRRLSVTGYVLSQARWTNRLEAGFSGYPNQVPLSEIERKTGLEFGLSEYDPLGRIESAVGHMVVDQSDIVI